MMESYKELMKQKAEIEEKPMKRRSVNELKY